MPEWLTQLLLPIVAVGGLGTVLVQVLGSWAKTRHEERVARETADKLEKKQLLDQVLASQQDRIREALTRVDTADQVVKALNAMSARIGDIEARVALVQATLQRKSDE